MEKKIENINEITQSYFEGDTEAPDAIASIKTEIEDAQDDRTADDAGDLLSQITKAVEDGETLGIDPSDILSTIDKILVHYIGSSVPLDLEEVPSDNLS